MMKAVKSDSDHSSMVDYAINGFRGFKNFSDAKLSKQWSDIRDEYVAMLKNEELVFEDDISFEAITDEDDKAEVITKLERMHEDQQHEPNIIPVTLNDWQCNDEINEDAPKKIEAFIEISSDRISFVEGDFREKSEKRSISIEMQDGDLRVLSFGKIHEAPMKTSIPRDGLITNDDHDYLIETSASEASEDTLKGPGGL